jgi:hypothetical protein
VLLTALASEQQVLRAVADGVHGLMYSATIEEMLRCLREVCPLFSAPHPPRCGHDESKQHRRRKTRQPVSDKRHGRQSDKRRDHKEQ